MERTLVGSEQPLALTAPLLVVVLALALRFLQRLPLEQDAAAYVAAPPAAV